MVGRHAKMICEGLCSGNVEVEFRNEVSVDSDWNHCDRSFVQKSQAIFLIVLRRRESMKNYDLPWINPAPCGILVPVAACGERPVARMNETLRGVEHYFVRTYSTCSSSCPSAVLVENISCTVSTQTNNKCLDYFSLI